MQPTDLTIRPGCVADLSAVQACARAAYTQYIDRMPIEPAPMHADFAALIEMGHLRVAHLRGELTGYVVFYAEGDHVQLENVAVQPALAGQGIGGALIRYVEKYAQAQGYAAVELYTNIAMTENLLMYPALGYRETGRRSEDGFERVFFRKSL